MMRLCECYYDLVNVTSKKWICIGASMGGVSVLLGAASSHWLQGIILSDHLDTFDTAVRFHMIHSIALILTAIIKDNTRNSSFLQASIWGFLSGMFFFSGSLYLISVSGYGFLGIIAPIGGVAFIAAWGLLAVGVLKVKKVSEH